MGYCKEDGCKKYACYNYKGQPAHYCSLHRHINMVNVKNPICEFENCTTTALYNTMDKTMKHSPPKPRFCKKHMSAKMMNVKDKRCIHEDCMNVAVKKDPNTMKISYCKKHMKELFPEMINTQPLIKKNKPTKLFKPVIHKPQITEKPKSEDTTNNLKYSVQNIIEHVKTHKYKLLNYTTITRNNVEYIPTTSTIELKRECGHIRTIKLCSYIQRPINYMCIDCKKTEQPINYFQKSIEKMSKKLNCLRKYYDDFNQTTSEDSYTTMYKHQICCDCKKNKPSYLFTSIASDKLNHVYPFVKYRKNPRCKPCEKLYKQTICSSNEFVYQQLLKTCRRSSLYRNSIGRCNCATNTITEKDIEEKLQAQNYTCVYSGRKLSFEQHNPNKVSIDRIDPTKGYTKDNIQFLTTEINYNKRDSTEDQFMLMIRDVYHHWAKPRLESMNLPTMPE